MLLAVCCGEATFPPQTVLIFPLECTRYTGDPLYVGVCIHGAKKENDGLRPTNVPVLNAFPLPHGFYRYLSVR